MGQTGVRRWLLFAMAIVWLAACGGNSPTSAVSCSQCVPSHDVAEYLDLAWQIRDTCAWGRLDACVDLLSEPRVHPPGLSAAIAMWWTLVVPGIGSAMIWAGLVNVAALSLLVAIGASLGGRGGAGIGVLAAVLSLSSGEMTRLFFAPMTEAPSLLLAHLVLLGAWWANGHRKAGGAAAVVGMALAASGLVRYSQPPILLLATAAGIGLTASVVEWRRLLLSSAGLIGPTLILGVVWQWREPGLGAAIERFVVNVQPEPSVSTGKGLMYLPQLIDSHYLGFRSSGILVLAGLLVSAAIVATSVDKDQRTRSLRLSLTVYAVCGLIAVAVHPFELNRLAVPFAPVALLVGLDAVRTVLSRWMPAPISTAALALPTVLLAIWCLRHFDDPDHAGRPEVLLAPDSHAALEAVAVMVADRQIVVIAGWHPAASPPVAAYFIRAQNPGIDIRFETTPHPLCGTPQDPGRALCYPSLTEELLASKEMRQQSAVISLETALRRGSQRDSPSGVDSSWADKQRETIGLLVTATGSATMSHVPIAPPKGHVTVWLPKD